MANILNICRRLFKHRQYQRFAVRSGTFVIVSSATDGGVERKVQLVDISLGGAAFIYQGPPKELEAAGFLKMFAETPNAGRVKFETVSDIPAPGSTQTSAPFRRRGVKFAWMGILGKSELKEFLEEYSLCQK